MSEKAPWVAGKSTVSKLSSPRPVVLRVPLWSGYQQGLRTDQEAKGVSLAWESGMGRGGPDFPLGHLWL